MEGKAKLFTDQRLMEFLQVCKRHPAMRGVRYAIGCTAAAPVLYYLLKDSDKSANQVELLHQNESPVKFQSRKSFQVNGNCQVSSTVAAERDFTSTSDGMRELQKRYQWAKSMLSPVKSLLTVSAAEHNPTDNSQELVSEVTAVSVSVLHSLCLGYCDPLLVSEYE